MSSSTFPGESTRSTALNVLISLILISQFLVIAVSLAIIAIALARTDLPWKDQVQVITPALTSFGVSTAALGGILTLLAAVAPRGLSRAGIGPRLTIKWQPGSGYTHRWDRTLTLNGEEVRARAVIIRLAIRNEGVTAAESVQVMIEEISVGGTTLPHAKFTHLRWSNSYDIEKFESLKHHRCESVTEPLIPAGGQHFLDFAFIFAPGSAFYKKLTSSPNALEPGYWCVHPFYQWLPVNDEKAVLEPGAIYEVRLAISAKNSHIVHNTITVKCEQRGALTEALAAEDVGDMSSTAPVKIAIQK